MRIFLILLLVIPQLVAAQNNQLWNQPVTGLKSANVRWEGVPVNRKQLNSEALNVILDNIQNNGSSQFSIPHPSGGDMVFAIQPSYIMAPGLQAKYPEIKTFKGVNRNGDMIRMDVTHQGMNATVISSD
ncbi:MAG: hypothetical protein MI922_21740, partial [Bacteroidales bacterium]|nr:hypothetical protein [Bacteroidales bacterium]